MNGITGDGVRHGLSKRQKKLLRLFARHSSLMGVGGLLVCSLRSAYRTICPIDVEKAVLYLW